MWLDRSWILTVALVGTASSLPGGVRAQVTALDTREMTWERTDTPGFPAGATRKLLHLEEEIGVGSALRHHPEGYVEPRHYHTTGAHSIYVLEGRLDVGGVQAGPGHFFHFPAHTAHGPIVSLEDSDFLIWSDGPLDMKFGDPPGERSNRDRPAPPDGPAASPASAQEAAVLEVVDSALVRISAGDMVGFTDLMIPEAAIGIVGARDGVPFFGMRSRAEERARTFDVDVVERGFDPEVMVTDLIAMVWLPYDLYVDGAWSHCGVDVFTLFRTPDGWRIATVTYSIEQPPACRRHPDGPPGG